VVQQLCRWLLMTLDRMPSNELILTQELVAGMLGVRRETISEALLKMRKAGFISYRYGRITVLDRAGLEEQACECYSVVKTELSRLLGPDAYGIAIPPPHARARPGTSLNMYAQMS
jgi:Mn-dependent DtxR family transcriptional regulator